MPRGPCYRRCDKQPFLVTWNLTSCSGLALVWNSWGQSSLVLRSLPEPPQGSLIRNKLSARAQKALGQALSLSSSTLLVHSALAPLTPGLAGLRAFALILPLPGMPLPRSQQRHPFSLIDSAQMWLLQGSLNHPGRRSQVHTLSPSTQEPIQFLYSIWPACMACACLACPVSFCHSIRI